MSIVKYLFAMKANQLKTTDKEALYLIKGYIQDNVSRDLSIATLAKGYGINRDKLKSGFKFLFGYTLHQYIIQKRMETARELLLQTDKPIKDISSLVGFSKRNFFTKFKAYYNQTPNAMRAKNKDDNIQSPF